MRVVLTRKQQRALRAAAEVVVAQPQTTVADEYRRLTGDNDLSRLRELMQALLIADRIELVEEDDVSGVDLTNVVADGINLSNVTGGVRGRNVIVDGGINISDVRS